MKRKIRISFNAPVTLSFALLCMIATILGIISGGRITNALFMTYHSSLLNPLTYVRFFTYVLGHGGWEHFVGNVSYLLLLGPMLEEKYGSKILLEIIAITALATALVNYVFFWNSALCGASGVVFAFIILASFTNYKEGEIPLSFILVFVLFVGQQVFEGIFVKDNVSQFAHIFGGIVGGCLGYLLNGGRSIKLRT